MSYYNAIPDYITEGEWNRVAVRITTKLVVSVTNDDKEERKVLEAMIKEFEVPKPVSPLPPDEGDSEEIAAEYVPEYVPEPVQSTSKEFPVYIPTPIQPEDDLLEINAHEEWSDMDESSEKENHLDSVDTNEDPEEVIWNVIDEWPKEKNWVNKEKREASPMTWMEGLPSHLFKRNSSRRGRRFVQRDWRRKRFLESKERSIAGHILREMTRE